MGEGENELFTAVRLAISDPGSVLPRDRHGQYAELVTHWGARAVMEVIRERAAEVERERDELEAALGRVRALHVPYFTYKDGSRVDNTVIVYCDDWTCSGDWDSPCADANGDGEHELPACAECRCVVMDGDMTGYLLWPCPTIRALDGEATDE